MSNSTEMSWGEIFESRYNEIDEKHIDSWERYKLKRKSKSLLKRLRSRETKIKALT